MQIVDNSIDEALAGFATHIQVFTEPDNSITVVDDGRGGSSRYPRKKLVVLQLKLSLRYFAAGGKFGGGGHKVSGGLHGVGSSVVNALSTQLDVKVYKSGHIHFQEYKRKVVADLAVLVKQGNMVRLFTLAARPRFSKRQPSLILENYKRIQVPALWNKARISITDKREGPEQRNIITMKVVSHLM